MTEAQTALKAINDSLAAFGPDDRMDRTVTAENGMLVHVANHVNVSVRDVVAVYDALPAEVQADQRMKHLADAAKRAEVDTVYWLVRDLAYFAETAEKYRTPDVEDE